eukprot:2541084-Pleurochrysis_carterae.AAC.1
MSPGVKRASGQLKRTITTKCGGGVPERGAWLRAGREDWTARNSAVSGAKAPLLQCGPDTEVRANVESGRESNSCVRTPETTLPARKLFCALYALSSGKGLGTCDEFDFMRPSMTLTMPACSIIIALLGREARLASAHAASSCGFQNGTPRD